MDAFNLPGAYLYDDDYVLGERAFPRRLVDRIKTMEMGVGDVVVATYPRAGTCTLTYFLIAACTVCSGFVSFSTC